MTRRFLASCLLMSMSCVLMAQIGNEWIDYGQTYYKFQITDDGIYRIDHATLAAAGLTEVDAPAVRLYHLGNEVPIHISTDGIMGPGDY
ncbi:MAG: hypothetical protein R3301_16620, partial [Saprospiraceae bacterium]|nr:hypothetical protein [Saprospiraceae bacterium]